jgi:hypothetical protein
MVIFGHTLDEGPNTVVVSATDAGGNTATAQRSVIVDLTAPSITLLAPVSGTCFGAGQALVTVTAAITDLTATAVASTPPGVAGVVLAGGGVISGSVMLEEGTNLISVSATDGTGLTSTASVTVVLDTTGPLSIITCPPAGSIVRGVIEFDAQIEDPLPGSGVASVVFKVDGAQVASFAVPPFESTVDTTTLSDGPHTYSVEVTDGKLNQTAVSVAVIADNTPPVISFASPSHGATVSGTIGITIVASDATPGVASVTMRAGGLPPTLDGSAHFS